MRRKKLKRTNTNVDKYKNRTIDLTISRAMVAEKDLEQLHHKHYRHATINEVSNIL